MTLKEAKIILKPKVLEIKDVIIHNAKYTLTNNGYNVNGSVSIDNIGAIILPFKFNKVSGDFFCDNNKLKTLKNCPKEIGGSFVCSDNQLTSLEYAPKIVKKDFFCFGNKIKFTVDDVRKVCKVKGTIHV